MFVKPMDTIKTIYYVTGIILMAAILVLPVVFMHTPRNCSIRFPFMSNYSQGWQEKNEPLKMSSYTPGWQERNVAIKPTFQEGLDI